MLQSEGTIEQPDSEGERQPDQWMLACAVPRKSGESVVLCAPRVGSC